jgi:hypothetical protein
LSKPRQPCSSWLIDAKDSTLPLLPRRGVITQDGGALWLGREDFYAAESARLALQGRTP